MPDGYLATALLQEEINYANKRLDKSRDATIKSWEWRSRTPSLPFKQRDWSPNRSSMSFFNTCQARIFEASRAVVEAEIQLYNAEAQRYRMLVDIYTALVNSRIEYVKGQISST